MLAAASPAAAQGDGATNEIVVSAQRSGAPMWTIETPRGAVILVGEVKAIPKATPWFPDRLEQATAGAERVILGIQPKVSPGDVLRIIFAGGKITKLPKGTTASDYLDEAQLGRLAALEQRYDKDYSEGSFLMTSFDILARRIGFTRDIGKDATDIVKTAARRARVPAEPVGTVRGEDMLDSLAAVPPETHLPCLDAAMRAAEAGPGLVERRGADWRASAIPALMANPLEIALGRCWPWADQEMGGELRGQWLAAIEGAMAVDGVTLAVVPLRVLAEPDGVLDQLDRRDVIISGPLWRSASDAAPMAGTATQDR
ncbi:TraB/GumN family protein [Leptolyngbya sp. 15MV]|nr:TraB/GumN family protein [Leptolyngbya sp. 15MV]